MNPRSTSPSSRSLRSIEPSNGRERATDSTPEWILCRNLDEFPIPDHEALMRWTEEGRVRRTDYLVNPRLDTCVQAKDMADLEAIFRKAPMRRLGSIARKLALGGLAVVWMAPLVGGLMLMAAVAGALIYLNEAAA